MIDKQDDMIKVLDKGYVRLVNWMGGDIEPVQDARVSYDKESKPNDDGSLKKSDVGLLNFLGREGHSSPYRGAVVKFECYAPLMVARQWYKYTVASLHREDQFQWNESSRRYITEEPTFYIPQSDEWRSAPENSKQGSGEPLPEAVGHQLTQDLNEYIERGIQLYERALAQGVAPELARGFLGSTYFLYIRWRWTASLQAVLFMLQERLPHDAQKEIQVYAQAVRDLIEPIFPYSTGSFLQEKVDA